MMRNRPQKELYLYEDEDYKLMVHHAYVSYLEKYCDELEIDKGYVQMHADSFLESLKKQDKEIERLNKALDKACEILEEGYGEEYASYEYFKDIDTMIKIPYGMDHKKWKEFLMKDE